MTKKIETIWCDSLFIAEALWMEVYKPEGYKIVKPISIKFNWRQLKSMYRFKISK